MHDTAPCSPVTWPSDFFAWASTKAGERRKLGSIKEKKEYIIQGSPKTCEFIIGFVGIEANHVACKLIDKAFQRIVVSRVVFVLKTLPLFVALAYHGGVQPASRGKEGVRTRRRNTSTGCGRSNFRKSERSVCTLDANGERACVALGFENPIEWET